ncbi:hypothetical protein ACFVHB_04840 [Kitasatospora sp. NPDC127111]|uniref:hypothetical protein n=1 Tax=Kitasatospora sp. NPDC127111 TaxID=3345363 RepID=UPI0036320EEC
MTAQTRMAGPDVDTGFFKALEKVFDQYPDLVGKYVIRWNRDGASSRGGRGGPPAGGPDGGQGPGAVPRAGSFHACCEWDFNGGRWECSHQCEE